MSASVSELVDASVDVYDDPSKHDWLHYWTMDQVVCGHHLSADGLTDIFAMRGTKEVIDVIRDIMTLPVWDAELGFVHHGFILGVDDVLSEIHAATSGNGLKKAFTGHSLGGARARLAAGKMAVRGFPVERLWTFGSPKPAFTNLKRIIEKSGMDHGSARNRNDIVPTVPLTLGPALDFVHTEDYISIDAAPSDDNMEALRDHASALYQKAIHTLTLQGALK